MIASQVREEMLRERSAFEQQGVQDIVALTQMMTQFENQKNTEIKHEASEDMQMRESIFRGEAREMIGETRSE